MVSGSPQKAHDVPSLRDAIARAVANAGGDDAAAFAPSRGGNASATVGLVPTMGAQGDGVARLGEVGLPVIVDGDVIQVDEPGFGTPYFEKLSREYDFYGDDPVRIVSAAVSAERMPKEIFFLPAFLLLILLIVVQRRRATQPAF